MAWISPVYKVYRLDLKFRMILFNHVDLVIIPTACTLYPSTVTSHSSAQLPHITQLWYMKAFIVFTNSDLIRHQSWGLLRMILV